MKQRLARKFAEALFIVGGEVSEMDETRFERGMSHGEGTAEDKLAGFCQTQSAQVFGGRGVEVAEEIFLQGAQTESATRGEIPDRDRIVMILRGPFSKVGHFAASDHRIGAADVGQDLAQDRTQAGRHEVLEIAQEWRAQAIRQTFGLSNGTKGEVPEISSQVGGKGAHPEAGGGLHAESPIHGDGRQVDKQQPDVLEAAAERLVGRNEQIPLRAEGVFSVAVAEVSPGHKPQGIHAASRFDAHTDLSLPSRGENFSPGHGLNGDRCPGAAS